MIALLFFALLIPVIRPAHPTVGDVVTITWPVGAGSRIELSPSTDFEVVGRNGGSISIRSFHTGQIRLEGKLFDGVQARPLEPVMVPVGSVLGPNDPMKPAGLKPPVELPADRGPWILVGIAAAAALVGWAGAVVLSRRRAGSIPVSKQPPEVEFLSLLRSLPGGRSPDEVIAAVADATRRYLSASQAEIGDELTTSEILSLLDERPIVPKGLVQEILRSGDLAKFSPWGSGIDDPLPFVRRAREIVRARSEVNQA